MSILRLDKVTKRYRDHLAVDEVSFEVQPGTIFGMLGPNGAGKTSTIRIITTITGPVSYTHLRAHETVLDIVCRLLLEKKNQTHIDSVTISVRP